MSGRDSLPPLSGLLEEVVDARIAQIMDAAPWELGLTADELGSEQGAAQLDEDAQIRAMVETAYRTGLKDGVLQVGNAL